MSALLQRLDDLTRHVVLVVLGEHRRGGKNAVGAQLSLGDDTLPFAEQIGQQAFIEDGEFRGTIGNAERDHAPVGTAREVSLSTRPPIRTRRSGATAFALRSLGL